MSSFFFNSHAIGKLFNSSSSSGNDWSSYLRGRFPGQHQKTCARADQLACVSSANSPPPPKPHPQPPVFRERSKVHYTVYPPGDNPLLFLIYGSLWNPVVLVSPFFGSLAPSCSHARARARPKTGSRFMAGTDVAYMRALIRNLHRRYACARGPRLLFRFFFFFLPLIAGMQPFGFRSVRRGAVGRRASIVRELATKQRKATNRSRCPAADTIRHPSRCHLKRVYID